jgi:hypothetical protein
MADGFLVLAGWRVLAKAARRGRVCDQIQLID